LEKRANAEARIKMRKVLQRGSSQSLSIVMVSTFMFCVQGGEPATTLSFESSASSLAYSL
jgi:hypothetical protein